MPNRSDIPELTEALRCAHADVLLYARRADDQANPLRSHDRVDCNVAVAERETLIAALNALTHTGISPLFTVGVDRNAQIAAFLDPVPAAIAAE